MLTLTETASTVVKSIIDRDPNVNDGALRIASGTSERDFAIAVVSGPEPGDDLVESDGARVFLEQGASQALGDKTLDAQVSETGSVTFALVPQG
ncbi:iron-sulfur cluster assembly protein [Microbacteriaceae bacterium SG_E_30_P1]|uniref:Iron-sulfur cluster assembly protein n=1 Tax=Antiquaquibacter oligotrophicus TaxID=2880260 RepID=A0ABT6KQJ6_9MICO|nr:iron-sulfur cluster assembly accessory protein [Antiquaquibacter oligotrophicus]MDH6181472.1 iron-sulfur cluster assembly protein [Antiquaquibacter oligotrophicus]UDF12838.1 iron-sulfur cluster assembly accessory protein [Antiquaquibacter oligotrophicus]